MTIEYTGRHTTVSAKLKQQSEAALERIALVTNRCTSAHIILTKTSTARSPRSRCCAAASSWWPPASPPRWRRRCARRWTRWSSRPSATRSATPRCATTAHRSRWLRCSGSRTVLASHMATVRSKKAKQPRPGARVKVAASSVTAPGFAASRAPRAGHPHRHVGLREALRAQGV
jgi:hypothetical protein